MIDLLITILIALSTGTVCDLGIETDWYSWAEAHPDASTVMTAETDEGDVWLYEDNGEYLLFVFREDISDTLSAGRHDPHGKCARAVSP